MVPADGWAASDRASRLPADWEKRRKRCFTRAGGRCEVPGCQAPAEECDHILPGDDHSDSNLQALCGVHHRLKTQEEARQGLTRMYDKLKPPAMRGERKHPGLK